MKCPGQDTMFWKKDDVFEIECPKCTYSLEFFKYDVKRRCRCGHEIVNPKIDFGCAEWCSYGEHCIEGLPEEMRVKQKEQQNRRMRERIFSEMRRYFSHDEQRTSRAIKVARYAEDILKIEGGHPLVVLGAAYLHEIGVKSAEEKYGSESAQHQGKEGSSIAREILKKLGLSRGIIDEICDLIVCLSHPGEKETLHFRILHDAKSLANMEEGFDKNPVKMEEAIGQVFKTATGRRTAKERYSEA